MEEFDKLNPFERKPVNVTISFLLKVLFSPLIFGVHTLGFFGWMILCIPLQVLICGSDETQPMSLFRQRISHFVSLPLLTMFLFSFGVIVQEKGKQNVNRKSRIIVGNHTSALDIMVVWRRFQNAFLSKAEVRNVFCIGRYARSLRCLFVKRTESNNGIHKAIEERVTDRKSWPPLAFFPEGTTTNGQAVLPFKTGAFKPGMPVQPVVIRYKWRHIDPSDCALGTWVHLAWVWFSLYTLIEIEYLPVYTPSDAEKADPALYAGNVRRLIADKLGVPLSEATFRDKLAYLKEDPKGK